MTQYLVLVLFAVLLPAVLCLEGPCNSYETEKLNDGYRTCVYKDSMGIPKVGVGFNLQKFGAKEEIENVGADYSKVVNGTECLKDDQIRELFDKDMNTAVSCVKNWISNWHSLSESRQSALADMAFNLDCARIREFLTLEYHVQGGYFEAAAQDMQNSLWCQQVGERCSRDMACMR